MEQWGRVGGVIVVLDFKQKEVKPVEEANITAQKAQKRYKNIE